MNDREKLIALLENASYQFDNRDCGEDAEGCEYHCYPNCWAQFIADHLIANGVVVREKGEWEIIRDDYDNELMRCPVCHAEMYDGENDTVDSTPNFCPNCGADMRIEEQNRAREGENDG